MIDVFKRECLIKNDSTVTDMCGSRNSGALSHDRLKIVYRRIQNKKHVVGGSGVRTKEVVDGDSSGTHHVRDVTVVMGGEVDVLGEDQAPLAVRR